MGKKKKYKLIGQSLGDLPIVMRNCHENHLMQGHEMIKNGETEINGEKVEPWKTYVNPFPVQIAVNHKRRLKKLVNKYGNEVIDLYKQANK